MRTLAIIDAVVGGAIVIVCFTSGVSAGRWKRWRDVATNSLWATGAALMWYVATMLSVSNTHGTDDIAAGAGAAIFAVPLFVVFLACSGVAALIGSSLRPRTAGERLHR